MEEVTLWKITVWVLTLILGSALAKALKKRLKVVDALTAWLFYTFIAFYGLFLLEAFKAPTIAVFSLLIILYYSPVLFYFERLEEIYRLDHRYYWGAIFWFLLSVAFLKYFPRYFILGNLVVGFLASWLGGERGG